MARKRPFLTHLSYLYLSVDVLGRYYGCWNGKIWPSKCRVVSFHGFIPTFLGLKEGRLLGTECFRANLMVIFASINSDGLIVGGLEWLQGYGGHVE